MQTVTTIGLEKYIAKSVFQVHGVDGAGQVVFPRQLKRRTYWLYSAQLEIELTRRSIPFVKYGGLKFLEAAHVKDVLSILRWCENPRDRVAGFRSIQLLSGIGPSIRQSGR
jgi:hypothetical protein